MKTKKDVREWDLSNPEDHLVVCLLLQRGCFGPEKKIDVQHVVQRIAYVDVKTVLVSP